MLSGQADNLSTKTKLCHANSNFPSPFLILACLPWTGNFLADDSLANEANGPRPGVSIRDKPFTSWMIAWGEGRGMVIYATLMVSCVKERLLNGCIGVRSSFGTEMRLLKRFAEKINSGKEFVREVL